MITKTMKTEIKTNKQTKQKETPETKYVFFLVPPAGSRASVALFKSSNCFKSYFE